MGSELRCTARLDGASADVIAHLETDDLILRGGARLRIPLGSIRSVAATDGLLRIVHASGVAELDLGAQAARWAEKIANPRTLLDKLGVKPGMRVLVHRLDDAPFSSLLAGSGASVESPPATPGVQMIFVGADRLADLDILHAFKAILAPDGAIWVVHRKGKDAPFRDTDVFSVARQAGLVDVKVARFSDTHTAEKLVIPRKDR